LPGLSSRCQNRLIQNFNGALIRIKPVIVFYLATLDFSVDRAGARPLTEAAPALSLESQESNVLSKKPFLSRFSKVRYYFPLVILMAKRAGTLPHGENSCVRRMAVRKTSFLPAIPVLLLVFPGWAETFSGKVVAVTDGDTIKVMNQGQAARVRLQGIDCPEKHQAFGKKAKQFTALAWS
jgi:hypothetical protein